MTKNNSNNKKNSKQKRVLIASILLAGVITIGGTFAWFTSVDEVTNKLTATSNYGVTIPEEFTPPQNWVPGQKVDKKVGLTNTGNVDAYARISLSNFIDITTKTTGVNLIQAPTKNQTMGTLRTYDDINKVTVKDDKVGSTDLKHFDNAIELYTDRNDSTANDSTPVNGQVKSEDEVMSIQAGGRLVYAPFYDNSKIVDGTTTGRAIPQDIHIINSNKDQIQGDKFDPQNYLTKDAEGNVTGVDLTKLKELIGPYTITGTDSEYYPLVADSSMTMTGLYVWERSTEVNNQGSITYTYTYAGYYYNAATNKYYAVDLTDGTNTGNGITTSEDKEKTTYDSTKATYTVYRDGTTWGNSGGTVNNDQTSVITSLQAKLVQTETKQAKNLTFDYTHITETTPYIVATYDPNTSKTGDEVKINIYLYEKYSAALNNNIATSVESDGSSPGCWTLYNYITTSDKTKVSTPYFYYNYILSAGTSIPDEHRLVKAVELSSDTTIDAYISFDYNLTVKADSVQVVPDTNGDILYGTNYRSSAKAVNSQWWQKTKYPLAVTEVQLATTSDYGNGTRGKYRVTWTKSTANPTASD
jgi:alternate signal-mediated exported protein